MLLTLTNTAAPASDLGFLLRKHPDRAQTVELPFGLAHVFYSEVSAERCTAALLLELDPVALVRGGGPLEQYVNDRPYVASSFLSVALSKVFGSAMSGKSPERPELAAQALPLSVTLSAVSTHGGARLVERLFFPLGYSVRVEVDDAAPQLLTVTLEATTRVSELLTHLYVLIPVLDDDKHYWVGDDEVEKLLRHGEGWLGTHPERDLITRRYLKHQKSLARDALAQLDAPDHEALALETPRTARREAALEEQLSLNEQRLTSVADTLERFGARRVIDLGCGEGKLLRALLQRKSFTELVGLDVSVRALELAKDRLNWDRLPEQQRQRLTLLHGSLLYRDARLSGFDAATVIEVIEHLDEPRLGALERVLFEFARPTVVLVTTPNAEFNVRFEGLQPGAFRHADHRFEWTRAQFEAWAKQQAARFGYSVSFHGIGEADPALGAPTQLGVFAR